MHVLCAGFRSAKSTASRSHCLKQPRDHAQNCACSVRIKNAAQPMLSWSDLHPCFQNAAIVVGFVALATVVDITLPRLGWIKLGDPHSQYGKKKD